jgi:hypothetical protein
LCLSSSFKPICIFLPLDIILVRLFSLLWSNTWEKKWRQKLFILAHSFRDVSPSWWGRRGRTEQFISGWPGSNEKVNIRRS